MSADTLTACVWIGGMNQADVKIVDRDGRDVNHADLRAPLRGSARPHHWENGKRVWFAKLPLGYAVEEIEFKADTIEEARQKVIKELRRRSKKLGAELRIHEGTELVPAT